MLLHPAFLPSAPLRLAPLSTKPLAHRRAAPLTTGPLHAPSHVRPRRARVRATAVAIPQPPTPTESPPPVPPKRPPLPPLRELFALLLPERRAFAVAIVASFFASSIMLCTPLLFSRTLDVISGFSSGTTNLAALSTAVRRLLITYVLSALSQVLETAALRTAAERVVASLRTRVFSALMRADVAAIEAVPVADLLSRLSVDAQTLQRVLVDDVSDLTQGLIEAVVATVMLYVICAQLAVYFSVALPLAVAAAWLYGNRTARLARQFSERAAASTAAASELLSGARQIKSFVREPFAERRFADSVRRMRDVGISNAWADGALRGWNRLTFSSGTIVILIFGGRAVAAGALTVGSLLAFILYMSNLSGALTKLSKGIGEVVRARGSVERILSILKHEPAIEQPLLVGADPHSSGMAASKGNGNGNGNGNGAKLNGVYLGASAAPIDLTFESVSFAYPSTTRQVLKEVSFHVPAGTSVALVGRSGGGKSTAAALMSRFYDPTQGRVLLGGRELRSYDVSELRRCGVGIVEQQAYLFSGTLAENIAFGREGCTRADVERAAEAAGVTQFSRRLSRGLDSAADRLSGGERQRVMIARCLVKGARVVVLDEPTSALDRQSEALVNETIERLARDGGRTVVLISHRLSAVRGFDKIVVLDKGRVVQSGTHGELSRRDGEYQRLLQAVDGV